jgi:YfiH family protein
MIVDIANKMELYRFSSFDPNLVAHAFFTRNGGISPEPWKSLNQGGGLGDSKEDVIENRKRSFDAIGRPVESIYDVWQVHSADIVVTEKPRPLDAEHLKADAIVTTNPEVTLFMRFADCVPIMLYSKNKRVIAVIHAGWQGTVKKIVEKTVLFLEAEFKVDPVTLVAGIGPSIGPCHYEIGHEVEQAARVAFPEDCNKLLVQREDRIYLDLWRSNAIQLEKLGVGSVEVARVCTACHTNTWFSHRQEKGKTGRFGAAIHLK